MRQGRLGRVIHTILRRRFDFLGVERCFLLLQRLSPSFLLSPLGVSPDAVDPCLAANHWAALRLGRQTSVRE